MLEWEYLIVTFDWHRDRPRYANDHEIPQWETRTLPELMADWEAQGWELIDEMPVTRRGRFLQFRRPKL